MAVSIRHVAAKAGVSLGTVSKVLNNSDHAQIAVETRKRVHNAARELGYHPNLLARSLGRQKTDTIGLMLAELRNPFFQSVFEQIEKRVIEAGYQILLDANTAGYGQYHELRKISSWLVDGVLMWATPLVDLEKHLGERARDIPVVYLGHLREDGRDAVAMDLYGAGQTATEHVLRRGYRRPWFVSTYPAEDLLLPSHQNPGLRNTQIPAFQEVCREAGLQPKIVVLENPAEMQESGFMLGLKIANMPPADRPDALICHNDWVAVYVYHGLLRGGLRVPDDIALVGFDGIAEGKYLPYGTLTTTRMPVEELCRTALNILIARMGGETSNPGRQILIPTELVIGSTT